MQEAELQQYVYSDRELQLLLREVEDSMQTGALAARTNPPACDGSDAGRAKKSLREHRLPARTVEDVARARAAWRVRSRCQLLLHPLVFFVARSPARQPDGRQSATRLLRH